jgi:transcriptional regulator with XRE-family HTH domain
MLRQTGPKGKPGGSRPRPNLALLEARMKAGLSREELGRLSGVSGKQVGLIERGVAKRSRATTLAAMAGVLEMDLLDLFSIRNHV